MLASAGDSRAFKIAMEWHEKSPLNGGETNEWAVTNQCFSSVLSQSASGRNAPLRRDHESWNSGGSFVEGRSGATKHF